MAVAAKAGATRQNLQDIAGVALVALQPTLPRTRKRRER